MNRQRRTMLFTGGGAILLSGCGSMPSSLRPKEEGARLQPVGKVEIPADVGPKVELRVLNVKWDPKNKLLAGLDRQYTKQEERQRRAQFLPPELWEAYMKGEVEAAKPRTILISVYGAEKRFDPQIFRAYRVNGKNSVTTGDFLDVTGKVPNLKFAQGQDLGKPDAVYAIRADGPEPIAAGLEVPWATFGPKTYLAICPDADGREVYPPPTGKPDVRPGLWVTPESLKFIKDKGFSRILFVTVAKDLT